LRKYKKDKLAYEGYLQQITHSLNGLDPQVRERLGEILGVVSQFEGYSTEGHPQEPFHYLPPTDIQEGRVESMLREKQEEVYRLRELLTKSDEAMEGKASNVQEELKALKLENGELLHKLQSL
jgi:hypothetical protein